MDFRLKAYVCKASNTNKPNKPSKSSYYICLSWYDEFDEHHRKNISLPGISSKNKAKELSYQIVEDFRASLEASYQSKDLLVYMVEQYKSYIDSNEGLRDNTKYKLQFPINRFKGYVNKKSPFMYINDLTLSYINDYLVFIQKDKNFAQSTINDEAKEIRAMLRWIFKQTNRVLFNLDNINVPSVNKLTEPTRMYFEDDELDKFINFLDTNPKYKNISLIFKLCYAYGLRRSECLGLQWDSIDFEQNILSIKYTRVKAGGSCYTQQLVKARGSYRTYPLGEFREQLLQLYNKNHEINDHVFLNAYNRPWVTDYCSKLFKKALIDCGLDPSLTLKKTRSSCVCKLLEAGATDSQIIQYVGHTDIETTRRYYMEGSVKLKESLLANLTSNLKLS